MDAKFRQDPSQYDVLLPLGFEIKLLFALSPTVTEIKFDHEVNFI